MARNFRPACQGALVALSAWLTCVANSGASELYRITSKDSDKKTKQYTVEFGGTKVTNRLTAFCPKKKQFVYLLWVPGKEKDPKPVSYIWDSRTGKTIPLYRFPGCPYPLPEIEKISDIKVCPFTGDKKLKVKLLAMGD